MVAQQKNGRHPSPSSQPESLGVPEDSFAQWVPDVKPLQCKQRAIHTKKERQNHHVTLHKEYQTTATADRSPVSTYQAPPQDMAYFCRNGVSKKTLRCLQRRHWSTTRIIDFHGLDRFEARQLFDKIMVQTHAQGMRCVHLIHGKGLRSPDGPVLKNHLRTWLIQHAQVLAFCDAPYNLGGCGTTLVLLRAATFSKNGS